MKFRILAGEHVGLDVEGAGKLAEFDRQTKVMPRLDMTERDERTQERWRLNKSIQKTWRAGKQGEDVIDSPIDLEKRFNGRGPGTRKFERIHEVESTSPLVFRPETGETIEQFQGRVAAYAARSMTVTTTVVPQGLGAITGTEVGSASTVNRNFDVMSIQDLKTLAAEDEIDLKGATRRDDILKIIKAASLTGGAV